MGWVWLYEARCLSDVEQLALWGCRKRLDAASNIEQTLAFKSILIAPKQVMYPGLVIIELLMYTIAE